MMRSFWLSAWTVPAPKLKASTNEVIKMCFIDAPHARRLLRQVGSSPAAQTLCILPNRPASRRRTHPLPNRLNVDDGVVHRHAISLIQRKDERAAFARQGHGAQYTLDLPVAILRRELDAHLDDL